MSSSLTSVHRKSVLALTSIVGLLVACGGSSSSGVDSDAGAGDPYTSQPNQTVVVGAGAGAGTVTATPTGSGCITLPSGECVQPQKQCKDGERADVVIDSKGKVVAIVCYPGAASPAPIDSQGNVELGKNNNGVVSIDGADDGVDVAGNVSSSGNNVTIYGQGAGVSVIGGKVDATGNNFAMRGVRVKNNVTIDGNNAALVLCVIEGDLIIKGNNTVVADCSVLGKIQVDGVNTTLIANEVGGGISLSEAKNTTCDGNVVWTDSNANKLLDPGESGAAISCMDKK